MMKKYLLLMLTGSILSFATYAQEDEGGIKEASLDGALADSNKLFMARGEFNKGVEQLNTQNYEKAIAYFRKAAEIAPFYVKARNNVAVAMALGGDKAGAAEEYKKVYADFDTAYNSLFMASNMLVDAGDYSGAREVLDQLLQATEGKEKASYYYYRGVCAFQEQQFSDALDFYTEAINKNPNYAWAYHDRASTKMMLDDLEGALKDYTKALQLDPKLTIAKANLATVQVKLGDASNSLDGYDQALKSDPENTVVRNKRGIARMEAGDYEGALEDFNKVLASDPDYYLAYNNKAAVYIKMEQWEKALEMCNMALEKYADYAAALLNRGIAKEMLRDVAGACSDWENAFFAGSETAEVYTNSPVCTD